MRQSGAAFGTVDKINPAKGRFNIGDATTGPGATYSGQFGLVGFMKSYSVNGDKPVLANGLVNIDNNGYQSTGIQIGSGFGIANTLDYSYNLPINFHKR